MNKIKHFFPATFALILLLFGSASSMPEPGAGQIVSMRRLTEAQYRNSIADVFGPEIIVSGRFEPIVRPPHHLIAAGASEAAISPAGLEQFDAMGRAIAGQVFGAKHRHMFAACAPSDESLPDAECAQQVLLPMGRYLFRRQLTDMEQKRYLTIAAEGTTRAGSFYKGLELSLATMLISPNFLYVIEKGYPDPDRPDVLRLDDNSRAARLSYFLWNTTPGESLLSAAARGELSSDRKLKAIATTMAASPRLQDGVRAFFTDMLVYENFDTLAKDSVVFPRFNPDVAKLLPEQMLRMIVGHLVEQQGSYKDLFTTRDTYMNRPLGAIYRVPIRSASGWEAYSFPPDDERAGLVGQAAFLALYAHSGRSSPTLRGRAIRELLLCQRVPDPPGNVDFTVVQETDNPDYRTARARLTAHSTNPVCAGCHALTDPLGLALESFDGIGSFRRQENRVDIDLSGKLGGAQFVGLSGLGKQLATDPATTACVTRRALQYASGQRTATATVAAEVDKDFVKGDYRIQALFQRIAAEPALYEASLPAGKVAQASH